MTVTIDQKQEALSLFGQQERDIVSAALYKEIITKKASKKKDKSIRAQFRARMSEIDIEKLKKPWMSTKSFVLLDTEEKLVNYVDGILSDKSIWQDIRYDGNLMPAVAVDTETHGLDTRIIIERHPDGTATYHLNIEIAGICLSADGMCGVYIPLFHEIGNNVPLEVCRRELQRLFDVSHLIFYHAKFDREVMRQTVGIVFRDYPYYDDVQGLHFSNDPKAELDDDGFGMGGEGLKGLSRDLLGMEQIELEDIAKVKAEEDLTPEEIRYNASLPIRRAAKKSDFKDLGFQECSKCGGKDGKLQLVLTPTMVGDEITGYTSHLECFLSTCNTKDTGPKPIKKNPRVHYAPFMWVPTDIALWYAAADAICTWLLWQKERGEAYGRKLVHKIDGELIDTLSWMERQRFLVDTEAHARLVKWSNETKLRMKAELARIANEEGWIEDPDNPDSKFNVDSTNKDLPELLFKLKGFIPTKFTDKGKPSCDAETLMDLLKIHPHDKFLLALDKYKEYVALHPEKLSYDKRDNSARIYLKPFTVAGGRLAAAGGKFDRDGGFNMNIQAIKTVGGNWWVKGDVLEPDYIKEEDVEPREESELDPSCFQEAKDIKDDQGNTVPKDSPDYAKFATISGFHESNGKWIRQAPGIMRNHIANFLGFSICLVKSCTSCAHKHGVLIPKSRLDANQILNIRSLFIAPPGYTFFTSDLSNIEMRVAANQSMEEKFIKEFLEGSGDFHTLTASTVFEEFNDPNTSKARRKELRSLAKIINFALLYGGTEYTIYENMKKQNPDITMADTKKMVDAYWAGVPQFRAWCDAKQKTAREEKICETPTGRIIKFESAMKSLGLYEPTKEQMKNYFEYLKLRKAARELEASIEKAEKQNDELMDDNETAMMKVELKEVKRIMDVLYKDPDSGVRNAIEYNKFMSKIQRVSVNAPLQGLAGDFMRIMLNKIRQWIMNECPAVQSVVLVHSSVHDEIDYSVLNPYTPFVVPRITRKMKLRKFHQRRGWPVPVEADTEYGRSWDVAHHLTGDDGHKPAGWTQVPGMAEYIPADFDLDSINKLFRSCVSDKPEARERAKKWMETNLHPRACSAIKHIFEAKSPEEARQQLFATLHLHEYWKIDETPDDQDELLETLEQFEARCGLTTANRGFYPEDGWLHAVALYKAIRKAVPKLGPAPVEEELNEVSVSVSLDTPDESLETEDVPTDQAAAPDEMKSTVVTVLDDEDDLLYEQPKKKAVVMPSVALEQAIAPKPEPVTQDKVEVVVPEPSMPTIQPVLIRDNITLREFKELLKDLRFKMSSGTVEVMWQGEVVPIPHVSLNSAIPEKFLEKKNED